MQTSAIWVKVHIPDEVLPFGLCLTYLYWISNFAFLCSIPYDLLVLFLSILPRWTGRNMCPSAVRGIGFLHGNCQALFFLSLPPWKFISFPGIVNLFPPPWRFILDPGIAYFFHHPGDSILSISRHFLTKEEQIVAAMEMPPWKVFSTFGKTR